MPDTTPTTEDRTRIADALATADGWEWAEGFDKTQSPSYQGYLRQADAVLAVLPEPPARLVSGTTAQPLAPAEVCTEHGAACHTRDWPAPGAVTDPAEAHRLSLSEALGLGTGAPWDAIRDRAAELHQAADEATTAHHTVGGTRYLCHTDDHYCPDPSRMADEAQPATDQLPEFELRGDTEIRASVLREASNVAHSEASRLYDDMGQKAAAGARMVGARLEIMADEAQQPECTSVPCPQPSDCRNGCRAAADELSRETQTAADRPDTETEAARVVAYRDPHNPRVLLCREHGERWQGVVPVTSEDLPDGGICTFGRLSSLTCGRDVLAP